MTADKDNPNKPGESEQSKQGNEREQALPVHNPLDPHDGKTVTQEDIENEQKYKEALTERD